MSSLWDIIAVPLGFIMKYCYIFVNDILHLPLAYVFALFLFTIITKALLFPLSLKQQKSTALMAAYKPMMDEIQKKYANDKQRQQEEMMRMQKEYGYNPMSGCLPMLIQLPIIFGLIQVIYKPLSYMLRIPSAVLAAFSEKTTALMTAAGGTTTANYIESKIVEFVQANPQNFTNIAVDGVTADQVAGYVEKIEGFNMSIGSVHLYDIPNIKEISWILIIPILSIVTMLLSTWITTKLAGTGGGSTKQMMPMMAISVVMFAVFSFVYPAGFSLYWAMSNVVMIVQAMILRKIVDPAKIAAEVQAKIEEKKKQKRKVSTVKVKLDDGNVKEVALRGADLDKLRLQKARERERQRYSETDSSTDEGTKE